MALASGLLLAGCASTAVDDSFDSARRFGTERLQTDLRWLTTEESRRDALANVDKLLASPLDGDGSVRIALAHNRSLQALLDDSAADVADAVQSGRLPNPVFAFDRLVRNEGGVRGLDIGRSISVSLFDLLLLPTRLRYAGHQQASLRVALAAGVARAADDARTAWVRAVAARQTLEYTAQVVVAADAGAELARRMFAAGNYNTLQRSREESFAADAHIQHARAQRNATASREALVRALGLDTAQASTLQLPDRLPDLPAAPADDKALRPEAAQQRLDVKLARERAEFLSAERQSGLLGGQGLIESEGLLDGITVGAVRNSESGLPVQKGFSVEVPIPLFDGGDALRTGYLARYRAAVNRAQYVETAANSQLRQAHAEHRAAFDVARRYRDEVVPLRKAIAQQNLLRYNGMLIGVFELLADARDQVNTVILAIDAQRDFWLADAHLQAAVLGIPDSTGSTDR